MRDMTTSRGVVILASSLLAGCSSTSRDGGNDAATGEDAGAGVAIGGDAMADAPTSAGGDASGQDGGGASTCDRDAAPGAMASCCVSIADCEDPTTQCCYQGSCIYCGIR
jgi:hypothetical protein